MSVVTRTVLSKTIFFVGIFVVVVFLFIKACAVENYRYYIGEVLEVGFCEDHTCAAKIRYHNGVVMHQRTQGIVSEGFTVYLVCWGDKDIKKAECYQKQKEPEGTKLAKY